MDYKTVGNIAEIMLHYVEEGRTFQSEAGHFFGSPFPILGFGSRQRKNPGVGTRRTT